MADVTITPADVTPRSGCQIIDGIAGATLVAGEWGYVDTSASDVIKLADANNSDLTATVKGMVLNAATSGQPVRIAVKGEVNVSAVLTAAKAYVLSSNAGKTAPIADLTTNWRTSIVGYAKTTSILVIGIVNTGITNA